MLTPQFKLSESQSQVIVTLRLPYVKISSCEFYIEEYSFRFYLKPYLLSLTFEQPLQQCEQPAKAVYYHQKHLLEVSLNKKNPGEHFVNLKLLNSLLGKNKNKNGNNGKKKSLVQVVGEEGDIRQVTQNEHMIVSAYSYGFCHNYSKVFNHLEQQCYQIFSFNPQDVLIDDRYDLSQSIVKSAFDEDAYLYDKYDNEQEIQQILSNQQVQRSLNKLVQKYHSKQPQSYQQFKNSLKIPNKELLVKSNYENVIAKQLLSIAFSYIYEFECMFGQFSVESAKTINNTSAILNCCVDYQKQTEKQILIDCARRCIVYSLYKNIKICNKIIKQLKKWFKQDFLCGMLANLKAIFDKSEPRYLLNTIYIDDYLIYSLKGKMESQLTRIRQNIQQITINEEDLDLDIQKQGDKEEQEQNNQGEEVDKTNLENGKEGIHQFSKKKVLIQEINTQLETTAPENQ